MLLPSHRAGITQAKLYFQAWKREKKEQGKNEFVNTVRDHRSSKLHPTKQDDCHLSGFVCQQIVDNFSYLFFCYRGTTSIQSEPLDKELQVTLCAPTTSQHGTQFELLIPATVWKTPVVRSVKSDCGCNYY